MNGDIDALLNAQNGRIMVVDDNYDSAQSMAMLIGMEGHEVQTAYNGRDALALAEHFRPEIMLMDIGMPDLSGYEVAQRLHECPWGRHITLIALTGWAQKEDRERAASMGFTHYLVKPVDPAEVQAVIDGVHR
jgi:CheY-like chemotaxis protein